MLAEKKRYGRIHILLFVSVAISGVLLVHNVWLTGELTKRKSIATGISYSALQQPETSTFRSHEQSVASRTSEKAFLLVLMPTVHRSTSYLLPTLQSLLRQVPSQPWDPMSGSIRVRVVNNNKGRHESFLESKAALEHSPYIEFVDGNTMTSPDWHSKTAVQRQSEDLVHMLRGVDASTASHVIVVEDDQMLCSNAMLALQYLIRKVYSYAPAWLALRTSVGFNGIVLRGEDVSSLASYIEENMSRRPPDHLFAEWIQRPQVGGSSHGKLEGRDGHASGRPFFAFRHNILYHVGDKSSVGHDSRKIVPKCYDTLQDWLQPEEMFHIDECPHDDVWPCPDGKGSGLLQFDDQKKHPHSSEVTMVDWTAARLCHVPCGNPLGIVNSDGSPGQKLSDKTALAKCQKLQEQHQVHVGASWGTLPEQSKREWMNLDCDRAFG